MPHRGNPWTERRPYPAEPREKYGAHTPSLGAHEEHTDLVESTHVAAPSESEIRARQAASPPSHAIGYGGIEELDDQAFLEAEWMFGLDPGSPPGAPISVEPWSASAGPESDASGEELHEDDLELILEGDGEHDDGVRRDHDPAGDEEDADDEDDEARASHAPEGSGLRSTFPSLDRISRISAP